MNNGRYGKCRCQLLRLEDGSCPEGCPRRVERRKQSVGVPTNLRARDDYNRRKRMLEQQGKR
jgi:hypothetical protein